MSQAVKCLILLAVVALLFVTELIPLAITATAGAIACGLLGFIPAKQVFSGLSNSTVVLFCRYVHRWRSNVLYRFWPKKSVIL